MPEPFRKNRSRILISLYTLLLFSLNFIRIFDNNFWGDEAYSIRLAQMRLPAMLAETAGDVHPPLYYILVRLGCGILGYRGPVFHMVSLLPYGIMLILALTVVWKRYGKTTSLLFVTLASLLPNAVRNNVEVRMYSWGALFVLLSYLYLWEIFTRNRVGGYVGFAVSSLAAAYTHYYCLISVAFFYGALFLVSLARRRAFLKKTLLCCGMTVAGYLPWFFILLQTLKRTAGDYWMMWIPTLKECISYFFSGAFPYLLFAALLLSAAAFVFGCMPYSNSRKSPAALPGRTLFPDAAWVLAGLLSMFGTFLVGILVSRLIRPLFIVRYLYPVSVIAWLLLGFCLSRLRGRVIYAAAVLVLLFLSCLPQYRTTYQNDRAENQRLNDTLAATAEISAGDVIFTDLAQIDWTISDYYYPGVSHFLVTLDALPATEPGTEYWLILDASNAEESLKALRAMGFDCEEKIGNGILGTSAVSVYRLIPSQTAGYSSTTKLSTIRRCASSL